MDIAHVIEVLLHGNQLKRAARTGWVQRGVSGAENVAAHTYGVCFATLVLAQLIDEPLDLGKALTMALLHDLPEGLTTDIPTPAWRFLPADTKLGMERLALETILQGTSFCADLTAVWEELHLAQTVEARLVDDADKIDLFLQALIYQEQTANRHLDEFWTVAHQFHFAPAQELYDSLLARRQTPPP